MTAHQARRLGALVLFSIPMGACLLLLAMALYTARLSRADRCLLTECGADAGAVDGLAAVLSWSEASFGLHGARALPGLRQRLGSRERDPLERLEKAVFGGANPPIDTRAVARVMVSAARSERLRALRRRLMTPFATLFQAPRLRLKC